MVSFALQSKYSRRYGNLATPSILEPDDAEGSTIDGDQWWSLVNSYSCRRDRVALRLGRSKKKTPDETPTLVQLKGERFELLKRAQQEAYEEELWGWTKKKPLETSSSPAPLTPLGAEGLLRLGGRIRLVKLPYDTLQPPTLRSTSPLGSIYGSRNPET